MEYGLTSYENIYGILRIFINEPSICKNIMNHKKQLEDTEILEFHSKRWKDISSSYFMLRDSYEFRIAEAQRLADVVKPDHLFTFYNLTGISYQVVDFIHELIKLKNTDALENTFIVDYKEWLEDDDTLFANLSKQIMLQMKEISNRI